MSCGCVYSFCLIIFRRITSLNLLSHNQHMNSKKEKYPFYGPWLQQSWFWVTSAHLSVCLVSSRLRNSSRVCRCCCKFLEIPVLRTRHSALEHRPFPFTPVSHLCTTKTKLMFQTHEWFTVNAIKTEFWKFLLPLATLLYRRVPLPEKQEYPKEMLSKSYETKLRTSYELW